MVAADYEQKAFLFFVEKVESFLHASNSPGILIGDRENEKISGQFAEILSQYRAEGTPYQFGRELKFLIDTVHFTDSHHSRILQLADLYVWLLQLCETADSELYPQSEVIGHIRKNTNILSPSRHKHWPTAQSAFARRLWRALDTVKH